MTRRDVAPGKDGWKIVVPNTGRASMKTSTKRSAVARAREIVRNLGGGEVVVHDRSGRIIARHTVERPATRPTRMRSSARAARLAAPAPVRFAVVGGSGAPKRRLTLAHKGAAAFGELVNELPERELRQLLDATERALAEAKAQPSGGVHPATGEPLLSPEEAAQETYLSLLDFFRERRRLLASSITASEVARLLDVSRPTPINRAEAGTLLGVYENGVWRFPLWQFAPDREGGVIPGLAETLRVLGDLDAFAKLVWFARPNPYLDGRRPYEALRDGETERVVAEAAPLAAAA